jgi:hypothetical protein
MNDIMINNYKEARKYNEIREHNSPKALQHINPINKHPSQAPPDKIPDRERVLYKAYYSQYPERRRPYNLDPGSLDGTALDP